MAKISIFTLVIFLLFFTSCSNPTSPNGNPVWLTAMISQFESSPNASDPISIWRYKYKEQTVYYFVAPCCDNFNSLYDSNGKFICYPDGGYTGAGDGKCSDFHSKRSDEKLIWKRYYRF